MNARRLALRLALIPTVLLLLLLAVEGGLRAIPALILWSRRMPAEPVAAGDTVLIVMGDSVPYGFGLAAGQSWPAQLQIALHNRGRDDVHVRSSAQPGARADTLATTQMGVFKELPEDVSVQVIVQVGHNDYALFGGVSRLPTDTRMPIPEIMPWWWDLRVARAVRWFGDALDRDRPPERLSETAKATYVEYIGKLKADLDTRGATLRIATYLVPGEATADLAPMDAIAINDKRAVQLEVNRLVRQTGQDLGVPVLDLAWSVPGLTSWDPAWFLDGIHPTAGANRVIADAVADELYPE